jgi:hypothetical protein
VSIVAHYSAGLCDTYTGVAINSVVPCPLGVQMQISVANVSPVHVLIPNWSCDVDLAHPGSPGWRLGAGLSTVPCKN